MKRAIPTVVSTTNFFCPKEGAVCARREHVRGRKDFDLIAQLVASTPVLLRKLVFPFLQVVDEVTQSS